MRAWGGGGGGGFTLTPLRVTSSKESPDSLSCPCDLLDVLTPLYGIKVMGDSCDLPFGVAVLWLVALCGPDSPRLIAGPSSFPDVTVGKCRDFTSGRCLSFSHDGLLDCSHPFWAHSLEFVSLGEFSRVMHGGWLPVPYAGGLPSSYVLLLIGLCQTYRLLYANM